MAFVCPTKSDTENKIKTANKIKEMLKDVEKDLNPGVHPVCVPFCVPLCNVPLSNPEESRTKIDDDKDSNRGFCFPCGIPCGPFGEHGTGTKKEHARKKHKREPLEEKPSPHEQAHHVPQRLPFCIPLRTPGCPCASTQQEVEKEPVFDPPQVMVCYREKVKECKSRKPVEVKEAIHRLHQSKSRELRASILYTGCHCERRNGLQDDCPRTGCHGSPECLTEPPTCGPSEFCDGKHLCKKLNAKHANENHNGGSHNGEYDNGSHRNVKAKYKCFPASIKSPVLCCSPCFNDA